MNQRAKINYLNSVLSILRVALVLVLVAFVLTKPVLAFAYESNSDKMEISFNDLEHDEDSNHDEDTDQDEESEEEDVLEELIIDCPSYTSISATLLKSVYDHQPERSSSFRLGIVLPPPELV